MPDRKRSDCDATWIQVARGFNNKVVASAVDFERHKCFFLDHGIQCLAELMVSLQLAWCLILWAKRRKFADSCIEVRPARERERELLIFPHECFLCVTQKQQNCSLNFSFCFPAIVVCFVILWALERSVRQMFVDPSHGITCA